MSARAFELIVERLYTALLGSIDATNAMELLEPVAAGWGRRGAWESARWLGASRCGRRRGLLWGGTCKRWRVKRRSSRCRSRCSSSS